jgi:hypothetical protein
MVWWFELGILQDVMKFDLGFLQEVLDVRS